MTATSEQLAGLAAVTMFRGDPGLLVRWCNFHLNAGAEQLYVVLDRPEEGLGERLPTDPRVTWIPVEEAIWDRSYGPSAGNVERRQVDAMRWVARRAAAEGHEFLAFVDSDEFLDFTVPFGDVLEQHPDAFAFTVPVREMWFEAGSQRYDDPCGATLALRRSRRIPLAPIFGWRAQYLQDGLLGHSAGKTIYRLPLAAGVLSVHGPISGAQQARSVSVMDAQARVLHFDCGSYTTWNLKWGHRISGGAIAGGLGDHRRSQLRLFDYELRRPRAGQKRFFAEFFSLDADQVAALSRHGLVDRIDIGSRLDGPLEVPPPLEHEEAPVRLEPIAERVDHQFAMVCDSNFVKPTFATMLSVLAGLPEDRSVRFVVLGDGLVESDRRWLRSLEDAPRNVEVRIHDITADLDRDLGDKLHKRSRATYGRVYLVDLLPEQRTIYLDGDVLATRDISELFELDLGDACIAGVPDSGALRILAEPAGVPNEQRMRQAGIVGPDPLEYLNAGVLVHDLDNPDYRGMALQARAHVALFGRALAQHDQDAINLAFRGRKHRLPSQYNYMTQFYTSDRCLDGDLVQRKYAAADASLIHFSGKIKPWNDPEEEFYNGLYRRIVLAAEEKLGLSCGFYFSGQLPPKRHEWSTARWVEALAVVPDETRVPVISAHTSDIELLDITDRGIYVRFAHGAHEHAVANRLRILVRTPESVLLEAGVEEFGPRLVPLSSRIGLGIRRLSTDLGGVLRGGTAHDVEVVLTSPDTDFERTIGTVEVLAAPGAGSGLLRDAFVEGGIDGLSEDGWLHGWYRCAGDEAVSLHIDGELVARQTRPPGKEGIRRFRFRAARIVGLGYGDSGSRLSVRVAGTNIPLPGASVSVDEVRTVAAAAAAAEARRQRRERILARAKASVPQPVKSSVKGAGRRVRDRLRPAPEPEVDPRP